MKNTNIPAKGWYAPGVKNTIMLLTAIVFMFAGFSLQVGVAKASPQVLAQVAPQAPTITTTGASSVGQTSATLNGSFNANGYLTTTWFQYDDESSTSFKYTTDAVQQTASSGTMSVTISGLESGKTYYFRAVGYNTGGIKNGSVLNFTTNSPVQAPTITTTSASNIGQTSATLNGTWASNDSNITTWFVYGANSAVIGTTTRTGSSGSMSYTLTGLTPGTTYSFRAVGSNSGGVTNGGTVSFTTQSTSSSTYPPTAITTNAINIDTDSATLRGTWDANGYSTTVYFKWGKTTSLGSVTNPQFKGTGSGIMSATISGLQPNTKYYYRAVTENVYGTRYGSRLRFTTQSTSSSTYPPTAITTNAINIDTDSATLRGTWDANGYSTTVYFKWGKTTSLGSVTNPQFKGTGSGIMSATISGLQPNTKYYYRAVTENVYGTRYGSRLRFKTDTTSSVVNTDSPTAITAVATLKTKTSAKLNGLAIIPNNVATKGYFEWGETINLGKTTTAQSLGTNSQVAFSKTLTGLEPGTIYYFRAIVTNQYGTDPGKIMIFQTLGGTSSGSETSGTGTGTGETESVVSETIGVSASSPISLKIESVFDEVSVGDIVTYTVTYENTGEETISDVILRVILPKDIDFRESSTGTFSSSDNTLTLNIEKLDPGQVGTVYLEGEISKTAQNEDLLLTTATMIFTNPVSLEREDAIAYALNKVVENPNLLAAAAASRSRFMPNTFIEWFLSVVILIGLVLLGRQLYIVTKRPKGF